MQVGRNHDGSGVFVGNESGRGDVHEEYQHGNTGNDTNSREFLVVYKVSHTVFVLGQHGVVGGVESDVEAVDETAFLVALFFVRFKQHGTQGRAQRQCVDGREADGEGHGETELTIEGSRCSGHEAHRNEHRHHHQRN